MNDTPIAPRAGAASPDLLKADPAFLDALQNPFNVGHRTAQDTWEAAHKVSSVAPGASTEPAVAPSGASAPPARTIDELKSDPVFLAALRDPFNAGHRAATVAWAEAHAAESAAKTGGEGMSVDERLAAAGLGPSSLDAYKEPSVPQGIEAAPEEAMVAVRQMCHAAGLSAADYEFVVQAGYGAEGGVTFTEDACFHELNAQYGTAAAVEMINRARSVVQGLPEATQELATRVLSHPGMGNNPRLIERLAALAERKADQTKARAV
jgi:hypothetical protein